MSKTYTLFSVREGVGVQTATTFYEITVALCAMEWLLLLENVSNQNLLSMALASPCYHSVTSIN